MKTVLVATLFLLLALSLAGLAQGTWAICPYDGAQAQATGATRRNPHAPPALECEYSHRYWDNDHWATHRFWQPCGS